MNADILLDPEGDFPAAPGVRLIESEVDFLRYGAGGGAMLIRGARLCQWAQDFYALRGVPVKTVESTRAILRRVFPALSSEQAEELSRKVGRQQLPKEEVSAAFVLNACFPADSALWWGSPSLQHAAGWLLWLLEHAPSEAERIVLERFASEMQSRAGDTPLAEIYCARDPTGAQALLLRWLGAGEDRRPDLGEFPLKLTSRALELVRQAWLDRIIVTQGRFFAETLSFPLPLALRQELARQTAEYYLASGNAHLLNRAVIRDLSSYLDPQIVAKLEMALPPPEPSSPPEEEDDVLAWFEREYLPYRRWQARSGNENARQTAVKRAQAFARWLLERYPLWLLGSEHLAFQKAVRLADLKALTLCVILDGLPAWDAEWIAQELSARAPRLTLLQKTYCFAALPTVTEFAKEALLRGVSPRCTSQVSYLGNIVPDNQSPRNRLAKAADGQVWFWRVEQPDRAYHFEQADKRERQVRGELSAIVEEIKQVVDEINSALFLNILITSDHGRLLNARSPRQLPVGAGMQAHGRAAWGSFQRDFPAGGFAVDEQAGWVDVYGELFGVEHNLRLAWDERSFANTNGAEAYPHGGLFPEEVIVPWFLFQRDAQSPEIEIGLTGVGEAEISGEVTVRVLNKSRLALKCREVRFSHNDTLKVEWDIPPLSERQFQARLMSWPPKSAEGKVTASLEFVQASGATFTRSVAANLTIKELYNRTDDLLKDLTA
ncbi:MAG: hypothetical protein ACK4JD_06200 [Thermoflexales bacterium]